MVVFLRGVIPRSATQVARVARANGRSGGNPRVTDDRRKPSRRNGVPHVQVGCKRFEAIVADADEGVVILDPGSVISYANAAAEFLLERTQGKRKAANSDIRLHVAMDGVEALAFLAQEGEYAGCARRRIVGPRSVRVGVVHDGRELRVARDDGRETATFGATRLGGTALAIAVVIGK